MKHRPNSCDKYETLTENEKKQVRMGPRSITENRTAARKFKNIIKTENIIIHIYITRVVLQLMILLKHKIINW